MDLKAVLEQAMAYDPERPYEPGMEDLTVPELRNMIPLEGFAPRLADIQAVLDSAARSTMAGGHTYAYHRQAKALATLRDYLYPEARG